jgi:cob(I)alamin adenosyltransferase
MKIYTKTGDNGTTSLIGGERVKKSNLRIETYGTIDELNSFLSFLHDQSAITSAPEIKEQLLQIQNVLFRIGAYLAVNDNSGEYKIPEIKQVYVQSLEEYIDNLSGELPAMKGFVLPGGHQCVSLCHIVRTVCRRAERRIIELSECSSVDQLISQYINRLSDYFFILARFLSKKLDVREIIWHPQLDN